ncbi:MAG: LuxR C-terminal-related transcriptional regulator [Candidatus Cyclobacteriaceae bacterium M2_1C_046]
MDENHIAKCLAEEIRKLSDEPCADEVIKIRFQDSEELNMILSSGPIVCSVFNHSTFKYDYISPNVEQMLGIPAEIITAIDYQEFVKRYIHPEDLQIFSLKLFPEVVKFIKEIVPEDATRVSIHYNYRMKTIEDDWIRIEQQTSPIKTDEKGNILLEQSFYTQLGKADFMELQPIKLSIFLQDSNGCYNLQYSKIYYRGKGREYNVTHRELEILKMLAKGKTSSQIGKALNISENTVITHKKNMLNKFNLKNANELIAYGFKSGFLFP